MTKLFNFLFPEVKSYHRHRQGSRQLSNVSRWSDWETETITLESNRDGIKQITEVLAQRSNINAIHIISHGSPGCLYLGNAELNLDTINNYIWNLQQWQGDIFLYGCNIAAGDAGAEFLQRLQKLTGANIAASANLTGSTALEGDWELEFQLGEIETTRVFVEAIAKNYNSVFAINRVPVDSLENEANSISTSPAISSDGRFVAFSSVADNLVSGDTNGARDVFVHDRQTGVTSLVSVDSPSPPGKGRGEGWVGRGLRVGCLLSPTKSKKTFHTQTLVSCVSVYRCRNS
ncbi:MAG: DUF4347 domain-containing protein [Okeania sp. SIO3H1]|nr:DUF4347 domain-containing protein [Okeania sp. SIO3H1]